MKKLLFVVTEDWYFCSHRLPLAKAAQAAGYDVAVATRVTRHGEEIRAAGIQLISFSMARSGANPLAELGTVWRLARLYRRERPDIVHHVAIKPVLLGSIAARLCGQRHVVNAVAGLGWVFSSTSLRARILAGLVRGLFRLFLSRGQLIAQNPDDRRWLTNLGIPEHHVHLIRGAGVDIRQFHVQPEPDGVPVVVLPARMLRSKGVVEFVEAARILRQQGVVARFVLVGRDDPANPAAVSLVQLTQWATKGTVEYWGHRDDMARVIQGGHIVCLPSYSEGLPKALLEAAACGRPIVATDVPGCREVVRHGENGLLVAPRDASALAEALRQLIDHPALCLSMGARGRTLAEQEFSMEAVTAATLKIYAELGVAA